MSRILPRPTALVILTMLCAMLMALMPSSAFAQTPPTTTPPQSGDTSCGILSGSIKSCFFGDPADLAKNVREAEAMVRGLGCWSCKVFNGFGDIVFATGREVSGEADSKLKPVIIAVATLFSLFYLGSSFVSGDASDLLGRWKVFWKLLIAVALGTAWLSAGSFETTWAYVYGPLLEIPLAVEQAVHLPIPSGSCTATAPGNAPQGAVVAMGEMAKVVCGGNEISLKGLGFAIGLSNTGDGFIGTFVNAVTGIILAAIFLWIAVTFPLRFIDVLLRLMVVGIVAPVLVVCAVFKPTRSYVQIGIKNVLYAGALFAFTGIMFKVGFVFVMDMITQTTTDMANQSGGQMLGRGIVLIGTGIVFSAMLKMAPSLAAEFSTFSGQSGGVGDAATGAASGMIAVPMKGVGFAANAATMGRVAGGSAAKAIGKGVT